MRNFREIKVDERKMFNDFIESSPQGHIFQSYDWGDVKIGDGWKPARFVVEDNGLVQAAVLLLEKRILHYSMLFAPRGPILDYHDADLFSFLIDEIRKYAITRNAIFFQIDPDIPEDDKLSVTGIERKGFILRDGGLFQIQQPRLVFRLDLERSIDEIFNSFSENIKRNIRVAQKNNVTFEIKNDLEGLKEYYRLFSITGRRKNFLIRSFGYQLRVLKYLVPKGLADVFLAKYQGKYIASIMIFTFAKKSLYMYVGSDPKYLDKRANHYLVWEIIKWAKSRGCSWFDFRGVGAWNNPDHPERGIYEFKKRFSPKFCSFIGEYYLILNQPVFTALSSLESMLRLGLHKILSLRGVINKMFEKKDYLKKNFELVYNKYGQEPEVEEYSRKIEVDGLGQEGIFIHKHFIEKNALLDIGCAAGRASILLSKEGYKVTGVDFQPMMIEKAKANALRYKENVGFFVMNACKLDFPDNNFQYALMIGNFVAHIPGRATRVQALKEAKRVLKPGGTLIISVPSRNSSVKYRLYFLFADNWRRLLRCLGMSALDAGDRYIWTISGTERKSGGKSFFHMFSLQEITEDIKESGMTLVESRSEYEIAHNIDNPRLREKNYQIFLCCKK